MNRWCLLVVFVMITAVNADFRAPTFSDSFERETVGTNWASSIGNWEIREGVLVGAERPGDGHGAVTQTDLDFGDIDIQFRFKLMGSPGFNVVIDDREYKGSHAGHICRVVVSKTSIRLGDDKTGNMENRLFAMRRDPEQKAAAEQELVGKQKTLPVALQDGQWYTLRVSLRGETMSCELDGTPIGSLTSPGIAHTTKSDFGFTVRGQSVCFDDVKAWLTPAAPQ